MGPKERVYSVLVVSAAENFNTALMTMLPPSVYHPVSIVSGSSAAKRALLEHHFDFIIINANPSDDLIIHFAVELSASANSVVLLLIKNEVYAEIYDKVVDFGVFTLAKPISKSFMAQALDWMASAKERTRKFEKKTLSIEEKMEEIRIVNRAKWLLISELKMNESDAHRYIEKQAMDSCTSKRSVAESIIKMYS